jgi:mycofactocin biosynthesis protein MftB
VTLAPPGAARAFDPDLPARLHPLVAVRDEAFGALAYHYGERRLVFLKTPALVAICVDLEAHDSARSAVAAHVAADEVEGYLAALARLFDSKVLDGR